MRADEQDVLHGSSLLLVGHVSGCSTDGVGQGGEVDGALGATNQVAKERRVRAHAALVGGGGRDVEQRRRGGIVKK